VNYFELFNLRPQFELDSAQLAEHYRRLQRQFHPDKFAAAPETERLQAMRQAAEINAAFNTLKDPLGRAEYLLALHGHDIRGEQRTLQDPEFLMQQLSWREELAELREAADPETAIGAFASRVQQEQARQLAQLHQLLDAANYAEAADQVRRLKFILKLRDELDRLEDSLLDL